jgi:dipeptidyl aminopeptidase/acylaminoacyl peptidase
MAQQPAPQDQGTNPEFALGYAFERYLNVRAARAASFAPRGNRISFLTDITGVSEVWSVPLDPRAATPAWPEQLTFRAERVLGANYSPTADQLITGGDVGGNERTQLYLLSGDGEACTPLTHQPNVIHQFAGWWEDGTSGGGWSPDGERIAYASNARDPRYFDVYQRTIERPAGVSMEVEAELLLQQDGTNYAAGYSPDGRFVLVERHDSNIRNTLLLVDVATREVRALTPEGDNGLSGPARHIAAAWSADRRGLYLLSDRGRQHLTLAWLELATAEMTYLRDDSWDAEGLAVSPDGARFALALNEDGYSRLELFDVSDGWEGRRPLPGPDLPRGVVSGLTWSRDGARLAFTLDVANDAPDVSIWDADQRTFWRATRSSLGGIPRASLVEPSLVRYPTFDGRQIPAFRYLPGNAGRTETRGLPVVVYVHGGPESQSRPVFNPVIQYLVGQGYGVLAPNVRGSTGYGYEYQSLDDVRLRMNSVADLRAAALWLAEEGIADPKRIAVMGGSYGGFMVLAALTTYPDLWAAGVDIVGIANFVTFLENTGPWRRKLREPEYGSLERDREFLEEISPLGKADSIRAPLFVVHGANDPRVPVGEAEQIVAALRSRNVPVEYLRFADEGHGLMKRANRLVAYPAIARFLDAHLRQRQ